MSMDLTGIGSILDFGGKLIDRIWPDPTAAAQAKLELFKANQAGQLAELAAEWENAKAQLAVNQQEAASESIFVSGWRPFVGWVCGMAFAYKFIILPILLFITATFGVKVEVPIFDFTEMSSVLLGMLGLGAMRSYDKVKGTTPSGHG